MAPSYPQHQHGATSECNTQAPGGGRTHLRRTPPRRRPASCLSVGARLTLSQRSRPLLKPSTANTFQAPGVLKISSFRTTPTVLFFFLLRLYFWNQAPSFLFVLSRPFLFFSIRLFYSFFLFFFFSFLLLWNQPSWFLILWVYFLAPFHFLFFWGSGFPPPRHFFSGVLQQIKHTSLRFKQSPLQARSSDVD